MELVSIHDASPHDSARFVAEELVQGELCNVRIIRLLPGQDLPAHRHTPSELMLYVAEGEAVLDTDDQGVIAFPAGSLARYEGSEELRVANRGTEPVTLLAFLTPPFPPR
jgi:quercetin dioxygenase-like cupin family protein